MLGLIDIPITAYDTNSFPYRAHSNTEVVEAAISRRFFLLLAYVLVLQAKKREDRERREREIREAKDEVSP